MLKSCCCLVLVNTCRCLISIEYVAHHYEHHPTATSIVVVVNCVFQISCYCDYGHKQERKKVQLVLCSSQPTRVGNLGHHDDDDEQTLPSRFVRCIYAKLSSLKLAHTRPLFRYFSFQQLELNMLIINIFVDDWIRTNGLWYRKRPLC